jgi:hypothetical protein
MPRRGRRDEPDARSARAGTGCGRADPGGHDGDKFTTDRILTRAFEADLDGLFFSFIVANLAGRMLVRACGSEAQAVAQIDSWISELAGDRVGSRVDLDPERAAWQLLYMTFARFGHDGTITLSGRSGPRSRTFLFELELLAGAVYRNRTDDLRITRGLLPRTDCLTCTDSTPDRPLSADCAEISRPPVPQPVPQPAVDRHWSTQD